MNSLILVCSLCFQIKKHASTLHAYIGLISEDITDELSNDETDPADATRVLPYTFSSNF